jgi:MFS family permease
MHYTSELRSNWKPLLAATLGLAMGASLIGYINSIFAPHLVREFGWTKASFALTAMVSSVAVLCIPIIGRLTDRFGVRPVATVGLIVFPLTFVGMSQMSGNIYEYVVYNVIQMTLCVTTTATVYSWIVAERFVATRGTALAVLTCGPALSGALLSPLIGWVINMHGWRTGYQVVAVLLGLSAVIVRAALPPPGDQATGNPRRSKGKGMADYGTLLRSRTLWILLSAAFLCSLPHALASSQLNLMLADSGISANEVAFMISVFAGGTITGRILTGLALDQFPAHLVAVVAMSVPSVGLFILGTGTGSVLMIGAGMLFPGFAMGAEGDVLAYLVIRHFGVATVSTILGMVTATIALAGTTGALALGIILQATGSYSLFMIVAGLCVLLGAFCFLPLQNTPHTEPVQPDDPVGQDWAATSALEVCVNDPDVRDRKLMS